jgi:hypothetical protein
VKNRFQNSPFKCELQRYNKVSDSFPFKWINKKWKEGFYVTSMATSGTRWAVVMSRNAGFVDQCVVGRCTLTPPDP